MGTIPGQSDRDGEAKGLSILFPHQGEGMYRTMVSLHLTVDTTAIHSLSLLFQHGVMVKAQVNCSIRTMLCEQLGLSTQYVEDRIKTIFLDGRPVDDIDSAVIRDGSTLALSAAMPGLVGAILRRGGHLAPLRSQITHREEKKALQPRKGTVVLKLFNLLIDELGPSLLKAGVVVRREDLETLFVSLPEDFWGACKKVQLDGRTIDRDHLLKRLKRYELVMLRIDEIKGGKWRHFLVTSLLFILAVGCGGKPVVVPTTELVIPQRGLTRVGYAIQVGAFSDLNNAFRLTQTLQDRGLDAYYFVHKTGLYKVRFGNFPSKESACTKAEHLLALGIIDEYYVVGPGDYPRSKDQKYATTYLRNEIVNTAESFIGVPYRWGGSSPEHGFDCSGFSMAVYHLNGLNLPRSSEEQWKVGSSVSRGQLSKGDLVFFATSGGKKVSHVGIYIREDTFIHAPGRNKKIRFDSLARRYFRRHYVGARTYF
jgi:hypothetical protein